MTSRISLSAFTMATPGHHTSGSWRHPDSKASQYNTLEYWMDLAKTLERGRFDAIFMADILGVNDVYKGTPDVAIRSGMQVPVNDPMFMIPAMAAVTENLGFAVTSAITYEQPYALARKLSTLDHLTKGRMGLNVVTSYLESAARNLGMDRQMEHDSRYDMADEFMEVVYKLWEGSWEDDAVCMDAAAGIYTDPSKVHSINHQGHYYKVPGFALSEPSIQRTPVIYQAGASSRGKQFAADHAETIFIVGLNPHAAGKLTSSIRDITEERGRSRDSVKFQQLFTIVLGETDEEAQRRYKEFKSYALPESSLALFAGLSGVDLSQYSPNQAIKRVETNSIRAVMDMLMTADPDRDWTPDDVSDFMDVGGFAPVLVGSPETVADQIEEWVEIAGIDGINLHHTLMPGSWEEFVELVVPELQKRGRVWTEYEGSTLREYTYGVGQQRIAEDHLAATYRNLTRTPLTIGSR